MGNVKLKKFIAVAMVAIMSVSILTGCSEESESTAKKKTSKTESSDLPSFQVKAPSGNYAKLKDEYSEDEYSEEIDELMNNKHIIDDNKMVIFWNHGGGSLGGVCYDEIYDLDHLTLNEIDEAFTEAF